MRTLEMNVVWKCVKAAAGGSRKMGYSSCGIARSRSEDRRREKIRPPPIRENRSDREAGRSKRYPLLYFLNGPNDFKDLANDEIRHRFHVTGFSLSQIKASDLIAANNSGRLQCGSDQIDGKTVIACKYPCVCDRSHQRNNCQIVVFAICQHKNRAKSLWLPPNSRIWGNLDDVAFAQALLSHASRLSAGDRSHCRS